jgi:AraC-like DNA-binding protein
LSDAEEGLGRVVNVAFSTLVAADVDEVNVALPGVELGFSRTDRGLGNTNFRSWHHSGVSIHHATLGFSMIGQGVISNSTLAMVTPLRVAAIPTRWEGEEAREGEYNIYGPGADHYAVDSAGCELSIVCADIRALEATAETLGRDLADWDGRRVRRQGPPKAIFSAGFTELDDGGDGAQVLRQIVNALSATSGDNRSRRGIRSTEIVDRVNDYLEASGAWFPSIVDMCKAAAVSERRLRLAFIDCYDMPPSRYLRSRALSSAHQILRQPSPEWDSVSTIALAHGFRHLSNFALYYRQTYGSTPSETFRSEAPIAGYGCSATAPGPSRHRS